MSLIHISRIQYRWRLRQMFRALEQCQPLFDKLSLFVDLSEQPLVSFEVYLDQKYDELTKLLTNKENIKIADKFVRCLQRCGYVSNLSGRKLLTAWLIVSFPEFMLQLDRAQLKTDAYNELKDTYPAEVYFIAQEMILSLQKLMFNLQFARGFNKRFCPKNEQMRKFFKKVNIYQNAISYFLTRDRDMCARYLLKEWYDTDTTIKLLQTSSSPKFKDNEMQREECLQVVMETQRKIYARLKYFEPNIDEKQLEFFAETINRTATELQEVQFNLLHQDLADKTYTLFREVVKEISNNIIKLCKSVAAEVKENLDDVVIVQLLENAEFTNVNVTDYGDYLIDLICKLQAVSEEPYIRQRWNDLCGVSDDFTSAEYMAKMLFLVMREIQNLKETILNIYTAMSVGVSPLAPM